MSFFNKDVKKEGLPELPSSNPTLPELPEFPRENSPLLPSYPTPMRTDFNMIKQEINQPQERRAIEISELPKFEQTQRFQAREPLFIKIERFKEAVEKFEEIKKKVAGIESSLMRIKEIKDKESEELKDWEEEIQQIKQRITSIDSSLLNKL